MSSWLSPLFAVQRGAALRGALPERDAGASRPDQQGGEAAAGGLALAVIPIIILSQLLEIHQTYCSLTEGLRTPVGGHVGRGHMKSWQ